MPHKERPNYTPTPEEIIDECRKIREGWSKDKWENQSKTVSWLVPRIADPQMGQDRIQ